VRIVLIGPASPWRGGIAHFNDLLAREMGRRHEVHVLTFTRQYPGLLFPGKDQKHPGERTLDVGAVPILDSIGPWSWFAAGRRIRRLDPDLLVFRYWMPFFAPCFGTVMRRAVHAGRPEVVMVADNVVPHERRPLDGLLTRFALAPVDRFVVMSNAVREQLLRLRPKARVDVVPHPLYGQFGDAIDKAESRRRLGLDPNARVLLFFGLIRSYKGLDVLLAAMPAVVEATGAQLLVVGEFYEDERRYRDLAARLGVAAHVRFVAEYVANEEVAPYFCAADVVTLPYRHATQSGIVPVAYHLDRPVICTDVGGLSEIVVHERSGLVVPPEDPAALAAAIVRYFEESWESRLVEGVRREKKRYTWESFASAVEGAGRPPSR
jgi:D-inositol-3-phosphate glycosyltransferase